MLSKKIIEDLCQNLGQKLSDVLPSSLKDSKEKCQEQFKSVLVCAFEKLDLVSREDFDLQVKNLENLKVKLTDLEEKISKIINTQH